MANSPRIRQALTEVFAELSAMTPTQLKEQLEQKEVGTLGQLLLETDAFADFRRDPNNRGTNKGININRNKIAILTDNLTAYFTKVLEMDLPRKVKPNYTVKYVT